VVAIVVLGLLPMSAANAADMPRAQQLEFFVVYADAVTPAAGLAAVAAAGGRVVDQQSEVGVATVLSDPGFAERAGRRAELLGVSQRRPIGRVAPPATGRPPVALTASPGGPTASIPAAPAPAGAGVAGDEPFAELQWANQAIHATERGSYRIERGDRRVLVGILDSGIDATHPDLRSTVDASRARNFAPDIPELDGPCEHPSCLDPANLDDLGHGTHVAGVVAAARNGLGTAGVAPGVTLVSLRVAQDTGFVFPMPMIQALVHSGRTGIDVANMALVLDPWLFHCAANPADSPQAQAEQRAIMTAMARAVDFARDRGVLPVASLGDQAYDLDADLTDASSPTYPFDTAYPREITPDCQVLPAEARGVVGTSRLDRALRLAGTSNYGLRATDVSAPGGGSGDVVDRILSPFPEAAARAFGMLNPDGSPSTPILLRDCRHGECGYYLYTTIASPFAAGVAALIVSRYGSPTAGGGLTLDPDRTERLLRRSATPTACPPDAPTCLGTVTRNSHYGVGIVDALAAVR
jgi:subtilisin family serine protease